MSDEEYECPCLFVDEPDEDGGIHCSNCGALVAHRPTNKGEE